jgi:hypothetical protein
VDCIAETAKAYNEKCDEVKEDGLTRFPTPGDLKRLIFYISDESIMTQQKRKSLDPSNSGVMSPITAVKEALVQMCIAMGNIRQPLTSSKGLQLMNILIKDSAPRRTH